MSRIQLALNVEDLQASIAFYSKLFDATPAKVKTGYANFALSEPPLKLVLIENPGQGGSLNHLGVEVVDVDTVDAAQARLAGEGLAALEERDQTCCYAKQTKFWVQDTPDGERWEIYTVLADSDTFSDTSPADVAARDDAGSGGACCGTALTLEPSPTAAACC